MREWDAYECRGERCLWQGVRRHFSAGNYPTWTVDVDLSSVRPAISHTSKERWGSKMKPVSKAAKKCLTFLEVSPQNLASSQKKTFGWVPSVQWLIVLKCLIYEDPQQPPASRARPFWGRVTWEMEVFLVRKLICKKILRIVTGWAVKKCSSFHRTAGSKAVAEDGSSFSFSTYLPWWSTV